MDPRPHVEKAFSMVHSVEKQLEVQVHIPENNAVYQVQQKGWKGKCVIDKRSIICDYWKKSGHQKDQCFKLTGVPDWYKELNEKKKKGTGRGRGFIAAVEESQIVTPAHNINPSFADMMRTEIKRLMMEESLGTETHQMRTPFDNMRTNYVRLEEIEEAASTNLCFNFKIMDSGSWIVDSGATKHVFGDLTLFSNYTPATHNKVALPDGSKQCITHIGSVRLSEHITLQNVLYIPSFSVNLLSVSQLCHDFPISFVFLKSKCFMQDLKTKENLAIGRLVGQLYIFYHTSFVVPRTSIHQSVSSPFLNSVLPSTENNSDVLWHKRLGHASVEAIQHISSIKVQHYSNMSPCDICHYSKQQRLPFPSSDSLVDSVF
ncbi:UNVERIFIED_CONTAM: hypothetical protein Slati_2892000 [Sesamum latifolium]|uniref:GAG-pre-integrase domain-containing protein n=1 Tax=Sesamum latifolium TaxID=2727402 RepID=A0AAW2VGA2_9LAMI